MHLIVDGFVSQRHVLEDEKAIYRFLDEYPAKIGMKKISSPQVFRYVGEKRDDWGISGFVFIAESHLSIHTFVERLFVNVDIFSCKDFDAEQVIRDLQAWLKFTHFQSKLLDRSWESLLHQEHQELKATPR